MQLRRPKKNHGPVATQPRALHDRALASAHGGLGLITPLGIVFALGEITGSYPLFTSGGDDDSNRCEVPR